MSCAPATWIVAAVYAFKTTKALCVSRLASAMAMQNAFFHALPSTSSQVSAPHAHIKCKYGLEVKLTACSPRV
jgi:BarA-like signal transduction histidine kinase